MQITNLMINPLKAKHLEKIPSIKAGVVTLNLEDAIAKERKGEALNNIINLLEQKIESCAKIVVRVNALNDGGIAEIKALNPYNFLAIRVPKVKTKAEIKEALNLIRDDKELHISLETKEAFYNIRDLKIDNRFTTANLGILDLLNSLNLPQSLLELGNPTIDYILSKFLIDTKSVNLEPVSFMYQDYNNVNEFRAWCKREKLMGFESKACLGPKQLEIANKIFGINKEELTRAKEIKEFFELHSKSGENGVMHEQYGFIDEPIYKDALLILKSSKKW